MLQQAVNSGDADVEKLLDAIAHHSRGEHGFLGDRDVAGAGGNDEDGSLPRNFLASFDGDHTGERMNFAARLTRFTAENILASVRVTSTLWLDAFFETILRTISATCAGVLPFPKITSAYPWRNARGLSTFAKPMSW